MDTPVRTPLGGLRVGDPVFSTTRGPGGRPDGIFGTESPPWAGERAQDMPLDMPARGGDLLSLVGLCSFCTSQNTQHMDIKENVYCITKRTSQAFI